MTIEELTKRVEELEKTVKELSEAVFKINIDHMPYGPIPQSTPDLTLTEIVITDEQSLLITSKGQK